MRQFAEACYSMPVHTRTYEWNPTTFAQAHLERPGPAPTRGTCGSTAAVDIVTRSSCTLQVAMHWLMMTRSSARVVVSVAE